MKRLVLIAVVAVALLIPSVGSAATPPPAFLCTRATLGTVAVTSDGRWWRCSVRIRFVGPYALTTYYWLDIGFPAVAEV